MSNDRRYTVLVTYGTQPWKSVYATKLTKSEATKMRATAYDHKYTDAEIVVDYDPQQRYGR